MWRSDPTAADTCLTWGCCGGDGYDLVRHGRSWLLLAGRFSLLISRSSAMQLLYFAKAPAEVDVIGTVSKGYVTSSTMGLLFPVLSFEGLRGLRLR